MRRRITRGRSATLDVASGFGLAALLLAAGCDAKEAVGSAPSLGVSAHATGSTPLPSNASATVAAAPTAAPSLALPPAPPAPDMQAVVAGCALPEPTAPEALPVADPTFAKRFDAVAACVDAAPCQASEELAKTARKALGSDGRADPRAVSACVAGLSHRARSARVAAAGCLRELGVAISNRAPVVAALLDKLENAPEDEVSAYTSALSMLDAAGAGYTCRVLRRLQRSPADRNETADLLRSLRPFIGRTNDSGFDYAYALIRAGASGVAVAEAAHIVLVAFPTAREAEVCGRATALLGARESWGSAAKWIFDHDGCAQREAALDAVVAWLGWLAQQSDAAALERPLLDAAFVERLDTWKGVSPSEQKRFCTAARGLADKGLDETARKVGHRLAGACVSDGR